MRENGMKNRFVSALLNRSTLAVLLVSSTLGCTRRIWEETRYSWSAQPRVAFYADADSSDILVAYNLRIAGGRELDRRAYWVRANALRPPFSPPTFVSLEATNGRVPIPVVIPTRFDSRNAAGWQAAGWPGEGSYVVYRDGRKEMGIGLPYYGVVTHKLLRVALTVPAVALDAAGSAAILGGLGAAEMGGAGIVPPIDLPDLKFGSP